MQHEEKVLLSVSLGLYRENKVEIHFPTSGGVVLHGILAKGDTVLIKGARPRQSSSM